MLLTGRLGGEEEIVSVLTSVHESVDEKDRTVDVAVRFDPRP